MWMKSCSYRTAIQEQISRHAATREIDCDRLREAVSQYKELTSRPYNFLKHSLMAVNLVNRIIKKWKGMGNQLGNKESRRILVSQTYGITDLSLNLLSRTRLDAKSASEETERQECKRFYNEKKYKVIGTMSRKPLAWLLLLKYWREILKPLGRKEYILMEAV